MASTIKVDQIEGSTGTSVTIPTGQTFTVTDGLALADLPTITVAKGGTNLTSFTAGDVLYATGSTTLAKLAKGTAPQVLKMNSGATAPEWVAGVGKQSIWIPSAAITPTKSNGCAARTQVETTAGRPDMDVLDFDASSDEHAQFSVAFPKQWNLGTVTYQAFWTTTATDTDGVAFALQGVSVSNDETIDVVYGTAIVVTDDNGGAAEDCMVTAESSAITIAGTPVDDDLCYFRFFRDVSDGNDDMTEDARLIGIKLFYTTDALTDD